MRITDMRAAPFVLILLSLALIPQASRGDGFGDPDGATHSEGPRTLGTAPSIQRGHYRYVISAAPARPGSRLVARIDKRDGSVERWYVRGGFGIPVVAYDRTPGGPSANGDTLVLTTIPRAYPPKRSEFAILDTSLSGRRREDAVSYLTLPGAYSFDAISPDGSRMYLVKYLYAGVRVTHWVLRAVDTATGRLLPDRIVDQENPKKPMDRTAITQLLSPGGRWAYTLYGAKTPFLYALDTLGGRIVRVDLPQLPGGRASFRLRMRLSDGGRYIEAYQVATLAGGRQIGRPVKIDTKGFEVRESAARELLVELLSLF